jgi:hypothetical protein
MTTRAKQSDLTLNVLPPEGAPRTVPLPPSLSSPGSRRGGMGLGRPRAGGDRGRLRCPAPDQEGRKKYGR